MDRPPVLCVGMLVCTQTTGGFSELVTKRQEIMQGQCYTIGSAKECNGYINIPYLSESANLPILQSQANQLTGPYHCEIKASMKSSQAIVKNIAEKGYTAVRGPRGDDIMRLEKDSPVLLHSGYDIYIGRSTSQIMGKQSISCSLSRCLLYL